MSTSRAKKTAWWPTVKLILSWALKLLPIGITIWQVMLQTQVGQIKNQLQQYQTASAFIDLLAKPSSNSGLVLAALLRFRLLDPNLLFATAYRFRSQCGDFVMQDLLNEYERSKETVTDPIGIVDLPRAAKPNYYEIGGWVLDRLPGATVDAALDDGEWLGLRRLKDASDAGEGVLRGRRPDLVRFKEHYPDQLDAAFVIRLEKAKYPPATRFLKVRVVNRELRAMVIFSELVRFDTNGVFRVANGNCTP